MIGLRGSGPWSPCRSLSRIQRRGFIGLRPMRRGGGCGIRPRSTPSRGGQDAPRRHWSRGAERRIETETRYPARRADPRDHLHRGPGDRRRDLHEPAGRHHPGIRARRMGHRVEWLRAIHPDDVERVLAEDDRTERTGEPFRCEYRQLAKDGHPVWMRDEAVLLQDEHEPPVLAGRWFRHHDREGRGASG